MGRRRKVKPPPPPPGGNEEEDRLNAEGFTPVYRPNDYEVLVAARIPFGRTDCQGRRWPLERAVRHADGGIAWAPAWALELIGSLRQGLDLNVDVMAGALRALVEDPALRDALLTVGCLGSHEHLRSFLLANRPDLADVLAPGPEKGRRYNDDLGYDD